MFRRLINSLHISIQSVLVLIAIMNVFNVSVAQTPISLYNTFTGTVNYTVIGGTLRTQPNTGNPCLVGTTSSYTLTTPAGATIVGAYLYWVASGNTADPTVTLNGQAVGASRTFTCPNPANGNMMGSGFADVTTQVAALPNGTYTFGGLTVSIGNPWCSSQNVCAGWGLVVVYNKPTEYRRAINIYDGFEAFYGSQIVFSPNNFYVPYSRVDGKMSHITWEGEPENSTTLNGYSENLGFNGQILTDALNPINNQFNSASSALNSSTTYGVDIDTYDITNYLHSGDTTATSVYSTGGDAVWLSCEVISVSDTSSSDVSITKAHSGGGTVVAGNVLTYTLTVKNNGPDTTGTITVQDNLPVGAIFSSFSGSGWAIDTSLKPVYVFRHVGLHAPNVTLPSININVNVVYNTASYPTMTNVATVSSPQFDRRPWNNTAVDQITVLTPVFLQSTKSFVDVNGTYPVIGDTLLYTIVTKNNGNYAVNNALYSNPINVIDTVPPGFTIVPGSVWRGGTISGQVITFNTITNLAIGATDSVRYRVKVGPSFTGDVPFTNIAHVRASTVDQVLTATAYPQPLLDITKIAEAGKTKRRDTLTYTITLNNLSTLVASTNTFILDTLTSTYLTYLNGSATNGGTYAAGPPRISWNIGTLAPGASTTVSFKVIISNLTPLPSTISNTARVVNTQRSADMSTAAILVAANATGRITGPSSIAPGEMVYYTLIDADLNTSTTVPQTRTLYAVDTVNHDREPILFTETGANTGIFTGSIATVYGAASDGNANGHIATKTGDSLCITYTDAADSAGNTNQLRTWWTKVTGGNTATLTATASVLPGTAVNYTLTDADLNSNPLAAESYVLRDTCKRTNELENITFTETGINTGVFVGTIATVFGTASNGNNTGSFAVQAGDSLILSYRDTVNSLGQSGGWIYGKTSILGGQTATITVTSPIHAGDDIQVTVTDNDLNRNSSIAESYTVLDSNMVTHEKERVTLYETGLNTGVFTGNIPTVYGLVTGANFDGFFYVKQNDSLRVTYVDTMQANGGPGSTYTRTTKVLSGNPGTLTVSPASIQGGDSVIVTVKDLDLNYNSTVNESYNILKYNYMIQAWETFTITERSANDSVFTGILYTTYNPDDNSGALPVLPGDIVTFRYQDSVTTNGVPGQVLTASSQVIGPVFSFYKTVDKATSGPGDTLTYQLKYQNIGTAPATGVSIVDFIPSTAAFIDYVSATGTASYNSGTRSVTWTVGTVNIGVTDSMTLKIVVKKPIALNGLTQIANAATLSATRMVNVTSTMATTTVYYPLIAIAKSVDSTTIHAGNVMTYTIIVSDTSIITATNTVLQDSIPPGTTYLAGSTTLNRVPVTDVAGTSALVAGMSLSTVTSTTKDTVVFKVKVNTNVANNTPIANMAQVTTDKLTAPIASNIAQTTVISNPKLFLRKTASATGNTPGSTITYTLKYGNDGTGAPATIAIVDTLPANTTIVSSSWTGTGISYDVPNNRILISNPSVVAGDTNQTASFAVVVSTSLPPGTMIVRNKAIASTAGAADVTDSADVIINVAMIQLTKIGPTGQRILHGTPSRTDTLVYTIDYTVSGVGSLNNVVILDTLQSGLLYLSSTGGGSAVGQVVQWNLGALATGANGQVALTVTVSLAGTYSNKARGLNSYDPVGVPSNTVSTVVYGGPQILLTKSASNMTPLPGDTITYTATYRNVGGTDAEAVVLVDVLPTQTNFYGTTVVVDGVPKTVNQSGSGVTLSSGILTITIGTVRVTDPIKNVTYILSVK
jgi:uncharacterized repeat protein (TIGR01451 family)